VVVYDDIFANRMAFSSRDDRLYAADTYRRRLLVFAVDGDDLSLISVLATTDVPGLPDGVAADEAGGVWVAFYRGGCIARFAPETGTAQVIEMPSSKPLSLCFAGPDRRDLYVVTGQSEPGAADTGSIYRLPSGERGVALHLATI
jgi:sugar lactone lactonase YvrE